MPIDWKDIETTGLNPNEDEILEIAWAVTADDHRPIARGTSNEVSDRVSKLLIRPTQTTIDKITANPYVLEMHTKSGLLEDLKKALIGEVPSVPLSAAEDLIIADLDYAAKRSDEWDDRYRWSIGGRSAHFDRSFIEVHMPNLFPRLGHRVVDVSNFTTYYKNRLGVDQTSRPLVPHRADQDIASDIREIRALGDLTERAFAALAREEERERQDRARAAIEAVSA